MRGATDQRTDEELQGPNPLTLSAQVPRGEYPQVSLADARKARDDARELIRQGRHPAHARQAERTRQINANALTFKAIAEEWIEKKRSRWAPYYLMQVERGMKKDIYPRIGRLPIRSVTGVGPPLDYDKMLGECGHASGS